MRTLLLTLLLPLLLACTTDEPRPAPEASPSATPSATPSVALGTTPEPTARLSSDSPTPTPDQTGTPSVAPGTPPEPASTATGPTLLAEAPPPGTGTPFTVADFLTTLRNRGIDYRLPANSGYQCDGSTAFGATYWSADGPDFDLWPYESPAALRDEWELPSSGSPQTRLEHCPMLGSGFTYWNENLLLTFRYPDRWSGYEHLREQVTSAFLSLGASPTPAPDPTVLPPPAPDTFGRTGPLSTPRFLHTATLLRGGTVLITGGSSIEDGLLSSTEIWAPGRAVPTTPDDPDHPAILLGTFRPTGSLNHARQTHAATRLPDGRVLITGGVDMDGRLASAEIYDPTTGTFEPAGDMTVPRLAHATTLLDDGRVLIVGGSGNPYIAETEIYDPATGAFTLTGSMHFGRQFPSLVHLPDGRILVHGAVFGERQPPEIYDPATGAFALVDSPAGFRWPALATALEDGRILLTGDCCAEDGVSNLGTAAIYDPSTRAAQPVSPMNEGRIGHQALLLLDGRLLLTGGYAAAEEGAEVRASAELFDPATNTFTLLAPMSDARHWHTMTLLPSGNVLVVGLNSIPYTHDTELFAPRSLWSP